MTKNIDYLKAMCHEKPYSNYAKYFGYQEKDGEASFTRKVDFELFAITEPQIANEFIGDFANKITRQHIVSLFEQKPLEGTFSRFLKTYNKVGDIEEYVASKLQTVNNYDNDTSPTNPFEVSKPAVVLTYIQTTDKQFTYVTLNYEQWYGAFVTEGGLESLAGQILGELRDAISLGIYNAIIKDLGDTTKFKKTATIATIADVGDEVNAKKAYEQIMQLRHKMHLPNKKGEYNIGSLENAGTPYNRMILFLNSKYASSFDINVLASLFNSSKIKLDWEIIEFDTASKDVVGILMDDRAYVYGYRITFTQSIMNPRNMFINTFHHEWVKRGVVPLYNAVVLKTASA